MAKLLCTIEGRNTIDIYDDGHAEILLANGSRVMIDAEDANKCKDHNWYFNTRTVRRSRDGISLGRYLLDAKPGEVVQYVDNDIYNCRKANLLLNNRSSILTETTVIRHKNYAELVLINNKNNEEVRIKIDLDDVDKIKDIHWTYNTAAVQNNKAGCLHRYVMNATDDVYVKFKNNDKTDCRKANLYFEPKYKQKQQNTPVTASTLNTPPKSSMIKKPIITESNKNYKNILHTDQGYLVLLQHEDKITNLGTFSTKEEAIAVYEKKVDDIYRAAAMDSYESLVASLKESDPYGLYKEE